MTSRRDPLLGRRSRAAATPVPWLPGSTKSCSTSSPATIVKPTSAPSTSATVVSATRAGVRSWKASRVRAAVSPSGTCPAWPTCQARCQMSATAAMSLGRAGRIMCSP